ncbi:peptidylprolyl isomerase [Sphingomonas sp. ID0503]|uniref:peptidylprolyl isomerase n=1 Tax=Sphingomonas sp. ID0503 TaxID=3399691 RepID=UPI003AFA0E9A
MRRLLALPLLFLALTAAAAPLPRVRMVTSAGAIVIELEAKRAPITTANFLRYVDAKRFDGRQFYRAARSKRDPKRGFVQGGIQRNYRLMFEPIKMERTDETGIKHTDGTISMAHGWSPDSALGDFFISVGPLPIMDARGSYAGYAAFGHVVGGMATVKTILASPIIPGVGGEEFRDQWIAKPVKIISVRRIN